jgi:hypothetical protein
VTRRLLWLAAVAAASLGLATRARAQTPADLLDRGVRAYRGLEFDIAAAVLRRAIAAAAAESLATADRARALSYIAASDYFRGRRDSAAAVYRRLVLLDPRFRPDPLIFPPEVTSLFDAVRRATKAVAVVAPDTAFKVVEERYPVRLYASSFHSILVVLSSEDGRTLRTLYAGPIGDSLTVDWDGLDVSGREALAGRLRLTVTSLATAGADPLRVLQVPLEISAARRDTLAMPAPPADSLLRPERAPGGPAMRSLGGGLAASVMILALPSLVAGGQRVSGGGGRVAVAGAVSLTGLIGFLSQRPGHPLPENARANRALRDAWQRRVDAIAHENADRRRDVRLTVHAGAPLPIEQEAP